MVLDTVVHFGMVGLAVVGAVVVVMVGAGSLALSASSTTRGCGCSVVGDQFDYDVVEEHTEWKRESHGAKVRWRKVKTELRRCEKCGKHYHEYEPEPLETREAWPENEPEIMPDESELLEGFADI